MIESTFIMGLSLTEFLIVCAALLILVDFFMVSDAPTHIAYILICIAFVERFDSHVLYKILFGILFWFGLVAFHYLVWRKVLSRFANSIISPTIFHGGPAEIIGTIGTVKSVEGTTFISANGDLWPILDSLDLKVEDTVIINKVENGIITACTIMEDAS
jgi:membrane protein implicated in regulation of membrane protease activity